MISDNKFYLKTTKFPSNFVPTMWILSKNFVPGVGFMNKKFSGPGVSLGCVTGQGNTCITSDLDEILSGISGCRHLEKHIKRRLNKSGLKTNANLGKIFD